MLDYHNGIDNIDKRAAAAAAAAASCFCLLSRSCDYSAININVLLKVVSMHVRTSISSKFSLFF